MEELPGHPDRAPEQCRPLSRVRGEGGGDEQATSFQYKTSFCPELSWSSCAGRYSLHRRRGACGWDPPAETQPLLLQLCEARTPTWALGAAGPTLHTGSIRGLLPDVAARGPGAGQEGTGLGQLGWGPRAPLTQLLGPSPFLPAASTMSLCQNARCGVGVGDRCVSPSPAISGTVSQAAVTRGLM